MSMIAAAVLGIAAETIIGVMVGKVADTLLNKLKGDSAKQAYQAALGAAIQHYAVGERLAFAGPLLDEHGLLSDPAVAEELAQLLRFERDPDIELIGEKWKALISEPPPFHTFSEDAMSFVKYLEQELRQTEIFQPVFEAQDLNAIAESSAETAESLHSIESQLEGIAGLLAAGFGDLIQTFAQASFSIKEEIGRQDFSRFIEEKTRGFVGRRWVFDAVNEFQSAYPRGYFYVIGDPGIGKSSLAAQLVKQNGYVHFFNIRAEGINQASTFLKNICAQLIAAYDLDHTMLPPETTDDAGFLNKLLDEVSETLNTGERCVIVVDALDEADPLGTQSKGANLLYLPITLPMGVYFVVTMRDAPTIKPRVDCEQGELRIAHDSADNLQDVRDYLTASATRPDIADYISAQGLEETAFVEMMVGKSAGNFMYLRYVLPEIASGAYTAMALDAIPAGLQNYYEDHWRRMRGQDEDAWFDYKLPVLVALSVVREPVSINLIQDFSKVENRRQIRRVLREWDPFLHDEELEVEGETQRRWRLYHASFFDFIAAKQEVADERVDLKEMHGQIADTLWDDLFGEG